MADINRTATGAGAALADSLALDCLSLCDQRHDSWSRIADLVSLHRPHRLYIGSYFCQNYFNRHLSTIKSILDYAKLQGLHISIVIPPLFQNLFETTCGDVERLVENSNGAIDELCLNDYGTLLRFSDVGLKLSAGRLLYRQGRDPRYPDFFQEQVSPNWEIDHVVDFFRHLNISVFEIDPTHKYIRLNNLPVSMMYAVHWPLCYQSVGSICVYANISTDTAETFLPNSPCHYECLSNELYHETNAGVRYIRQGRAILFENYDCIISAQSSYRRIIPADRYLEALK